MSTEEGDVKDEDETKISQNDFFDVKVPDILNGASNNETTGNELNDNWYKVKGWYNELSYYSKVFQFFVEEIKETESKYGWWIIVVSSMTSFITMSTLDPFNLNEQETIYYNWTKNLVISVLTIFTTLIATWIKKKGLYQKNTSSR